MTEGFGAGSRRYEQIRIREARKQDPDPQHRKKWLTFWWRWCVRRVWPWESVAWRPAQRRTAGRRGQWREPTGSSLKKRVVFVNVQAGQCCGSMPLTNGSRSGFGSGCGSSYFIIDLQDANRKLIFYLKFFCILLLEGTFTSFVKRKK